jgi:antitoxin ParD1/3/4
LLRAEQERCWNGGTLRAGMLPSSMAAKFSRHIALAGPLAEYVDAQVAKGEYASASEMVRAALRILMKSDRSGNRSRSVDPQRSPPHE